LEEGWISQSTMADVSAQVPSQPQPLKAEPAVMEDPPRLDDAMLDQLRAQVAAALEAKMGQRAEICVGSAPIQRERAIILSWRLDSAQNGRDTTSDFDPQRDDGVLFYLALRFPRGKMEEEGDENNNKGVVGKQVGDEGIGLEDREEDVLQGQGDQAEESDRESEKNQSFIQEEPNDQSGEGEDKTADDEEEDEAVVDQVEVQHWYDETTMQRNVSVDDVKSMFVDDRFAKGDNIPPELLTELIRDEMEKDDVEKDDSGLGTSSEGEGVEKGRRKSSKTVRWRERLEDAFPAAEDKRQHRRGLYRRRQASPARISTAAATIQQRWSPVPADYSGRVGVLTARLPEKVERATSRWIRRLRARHVEGAAGAWFPPATSPDGFNSYGSRRYDVSGLLEEDDGTDKRYYYYQTLPRVVANQHRARTPPFRRQACAREEDEPEGE